MTHPKTALDRMVEDQAYRTANTAGLSIEDLPWIYSPPGFQSFDLQGSIALPAIGASGTILSYDVPPGYDGVIKRLSANITGGGFVQGSGDLIWRILQGGGAVKGYDNILTELGDIKTPRPTDGILIFQGQRVEMTIDNLAIGGAGFFALGSFAGYLWPKGA